ncbi:MAG: hypothetical protein J2P48_17925 [Alphaproteobacteria bacterium]|nr:hypothetical protein [Alphaproteobacteria bacterium]
METRSGSARPLREFAFDIRKMVETRPLCSHAMRLTALHAFVHASMVRRAAASGTPSLSPARRNNGEDFRFDGVFWSYELTADRPSLARKITVPSRRS